VRPFFADTNLQWYDGDFRLRVTKELPVQYPRSGETLHPSLELCRKNGGELRGPEGTLVWS
jgi:hypothetical protein